ncbi:MAG: hypothetical protein U1E74_05735 [Paenacidovorax caeni]
MPESPRLDRAQGVARHACARCKLYRTQALGLAQALEAVAQLQEQLAFKEGEIHRQSFAQ